MSDYSTSKMLGKLAVGKVKTQPENTLDEEMQEIEEVFSVPQLKPSAEPQMKEVLANILSPSFSKKHSPVDK
ncbi:MAG: hypothetical protein HYX60_06200 [Legionella longbeachae]|nr:hypothetical protein [Legionella longbeachae]